MDDDHPAARGHPRRAGARRSASTRGPPASREIGNPHRQTNAPRTGQETPMSKVAVFGAGSWGTAFSLVLADAGNDVTLWARREELCATINDKRENPDYLPGIELPDAITRDPRPRARRWRAPRSWCSPCPSQTLRENLEDWADLIPRDARAGVADEGRRARHPQADERGDRRGHRRRTRADRRGQRPQPGPGDRQPGAGRQRGRLRRRGGRQAAARRCCHSRDVPALLQHRRGRLRARRRLQERHRARASGWPSGSASATTPPPR